MLRDQTGHSSTSTLLDGGVQLGDIQVDSHAGSGRVRVGRPGSSAWYQEARRQQRPSIQPDVTQSSSQHKLAAPGVLLY